MKICNKCEKKKPIEEYRVYAGVENLQCNRCCEMAKIAAKKLKEARLQAAQLRETTKPDDKVNAFHWRTFVQPAPMKASKWEQQPRPDQAVNSRFTQYS